MQELYSKGPSHWVFYHRFMFVAQYAQFHESLANRDYVNAAKTVVSIIREELVPRAWAAVVLSDSIPLIRFGTLIVSSAFPFCNANYTHTDKELLFDTSEALVLLQKLEEVINGVSQGAEEDYLSLYKRLLVMRQWQQRQTGKRETKEEDVSTADALNQLGSVRLFLAQYFARCAVLGGARAAAAVR